MLLLAPLTTEDADDIVMQKLRVVAKYVDIWTTWRLWNFRSIAYSTTQYTMFNVMKDIRNLDPSALAQKLFDGLDSEEQDFDTEDDLRLHQQNNRYLSRMLARIADYVEVESGNPSRYVEYVHGKGKKKYDVEHIWANKPDRHRGEFPSASEFDDYRNRIGGLLLLPSSFNRAYGALSYEKKHSHYDSQNLLARSLHKNCYELNPGFRKFVRTSGLPFRAHEHFTKADLDERGELYRSIAKQIWDPDQLLREVGLPVPGIDDLPLADLGNVADNGPGKKKAAEKLAALAKGANIDPDDYVTWAEVAQILG